MVNVCHQIPSINLNFLDKSWWCFKSSCHPISPTNPGGNIVLSRNSYDKSRLWGNDGYHLTPLINPGGVAALFITEFSHRLKSCVDMYLWIPLINLSNAVMMSVTGFSQYTLATVFITQLLSIKPCSVVIMPSLLRGASALLCAWCIVLDDVPEWPSGGYRCWLYERSVSRCRNVTSLFALSSGVCLGHVRLVQVSVGMANLSSYLSAEY